MTASSKEKQGCLSIFFPFLRPAQNQEGSQPLPYRLQDDFLSPAEFSFYKVLCSLGDARFTVQSKVRLADVFFVARPHENVSFFNRIAQKHMDFLLGDSSTMKPLLAMS